MELEKLEQQILEKFKVYLKTRSEAVSLNQEDKIASALLIEKYAYGVIDTLKVMGIHLINFENQLLNACKDIDTDYTKNRRLKYDGKLKISAVNPNELSISLIFNKNSGVLAGAFLNSDSAINYISNSNDLVLKNVEVITN